MLYFFSERIIKLEFNIQLFILYLFFGYKLQIIHSKERLKREISRNKII